MVVMNTIILGAYFDASLNIVQLLSSIISLVFLLGVAFVTQKSLSKMAEERPYIIFGYCARLKEYLNYIEWNLGTQDRTPLYNLLSETYRGREQVGGIPAPEKLVEVVEKLYQFLMSENIQIPLNMDFDNSLHELTQKLRPILGMGIDFPYESKEKVVELYNEITESISILQNMITNAQRELIEQYDLSQKNWRERISNYIDKCKSVFIERETEV